MVTEMREIDSLLEQAEHHLEQVSAYRRHNTDAAKLCAGEALGAAKQCIGRARELAAARRAA